MIRLSRSQAGFADSRLARDQHDLAVAFPGGRWRSIRNSISFSRPIIGQTGRVDRLEPAPEIGYAFDHPRGDRLRHALELMPAEVAQMEPVAEQPACGCGNDNGAGIDQGLNAAAMFGVSPTTRAPATHPLGLGADHHQAAGDANADGEGLRPAS